MGNKLYYWSELYRVKLFNKNVLIEWILTSDVCWALRCSASGQGRPSCSRRWSLVRRHCRYPCYFSGTTKNQSHPAGCRDPLPKMNFEMSFKMVTSNIVSNRRYALKIHWQEQFQNFSETRMNWYTSLFYKG